MQVYNLDKKLYALCHCAASVYLVVKCFINLAHLLHEMYDEPARSKYIPHVGAEQTGKDI